MAKLFKWVVFLALGLMLLLAAVAFTLHRWVGTDDFRQRMEREATAALGVPVALDHVAVDVWPLPAVALSGVAVKTQPALTVERVEMRPLWRPLLRGQLVVATLLVRRAVLPQQGIDAVLLALQKKKLAVPANTVPAAPQKVAAAAADASIDDGSAALAWLPRRTVLDNVTWISTTGAATTLEAEATLDDDGLPDTASLKLLKGHLQGLQASLKREVPAVATTAPGATDASAAATGAAALAGNAWALNVAVGGGTVEGKIGLQRTAVTGGARAGNKGAELAIRGELVTRGVEVSALTAPSSTLTGKLDATTSLNARAATTSALAEALQSSTTFTVQGAVINGLDLVKAVQTIGLSRGGQTRLDTLAGQVNTQGRAAHLTNLVASSGALSATGNVSVSAAKALSGALSVNLAGDSKIGKAIGSAVGVPLNVSGTLDNPEVTLSRAALLGAAIGTALMPGVGTGAGASLGNRIGEGFRGLFGK